MSDQMLRQDAARSDQQNGQNDPKGNRQVDNDKKQEDARQDGKHTSLLPVTGVSPANAKSKKQRPWLKPLLIVIGLIVLLIGIPWGLNYWHYSQTHVSTDDAYVTGNLVNVSPIISGTLQQLTVDQGSYVRRGQLIARLDNSGPLASLRQAQANYKAAMSQIPQAQRNLLYQQQATDASIRKAQAALAAQQAKASGAQQQLTLASGTTRNQVRQAQSQIQAAQAQWQQMLAQANAAQTNVANYQQAVQTALASLQNAQQQVQTAQKAVDTAQAHVRAAQADVDRTAKDEVRYRLLYAEDAVSAQVYDNARAQAQSSSANLQADQSQVGAAQSQVEQAQAGVRQAQSQVEQARKSVAQTQAQARAAQRAADAAQEQVDVARAGLGLAQANRMQVGIQAASLLSTTRETGEYAADVANARAGEQQVAVRRRQIETYRAQAQQALAALNNAQITLNDTYIYAPDEGTVVIKNVNAGAALSPGQTILTMTQGDDVWVEANFKETQLTQVRPGQPAEISVDAFPGRVFKGRVQSINEATGAATSLLPPENATGNFTKVVQRIPVRIEFVAAQPGEDAKYAREKDILSLRQGMSVNATIDTSGSTEKGQQPAQAHGSGGQAGAPTQGTTGSSSGMGNGYGGGSMGSSAVNEGSSTSVNPGSAPAAGAGSSSGGLNSGQSGSGGANAPNSGAGMINGPSVPNNVPNPGAGTSNPNGQSSGQNMTPHIGPGSGLNNGPDMGAPGANGGSNGSSGPGGQTPGSGSNNAGQSGNVSGAGGGFNAGAGTAPAAGSAPGGVNDTGAGATGRTGSANGSGVGTGAAGATGTGTGTGGGR